MKPRTALLGLVLAAASCGGGSDPAPTASSATTPSSAADAGTPAGEAACRFVLVLDQKRREIVEIATSERPAWMIEADLKNWSISTGRVPMAPELVAATGDGARLRADVQSMQQAVVDGARTLAGGAHDDAAIDRVLGPVTRWIREAWTGASCERALGTPLDGG